ncbi:glycine-rich domain-containing protein [Bdellovibrio sp.]|uniref:glycine-rich domain-containing protein n=1 Tax=Bdellovibrio sp. TaxID=28201 RepID=UPI0039E60824
MKNYQVAFLAMMILAQTTWAYVPGGVNFQGRIIKPTGEPLEASSVVFTMKVMDPTANDCLLYEETQTVNMSNSDGVFNVVVGQGTRTASDPGKSVSAVFSNSSTPLTGLTCLGGVTAYTPSVGDIRKIRVIFNDGTQTVTLGSDFEVRSVPYAMYAQSLQGKTPTNFVQTSANITQPNVESVFSHFTELMDIVSGSSSLYMRSGAGAQSLSGTYTFSGGVSAPDPTVGSNVATKSYTDSKIAGRDADLTGLSDGMVIKWNGAQSKFIVATVSGGGGGSVTAVTAAAPLISSGGASPEISLESGTATSQVLYWNGAAWTKQYLKASDLKNTLGQAQIPSCTNKQTLSWNSGTDKYDCVDISIAGIQISTDLIVNAAGFTGSLAGDITGTQGTTSLDKIKGKPLATNLNALAAGDNGKVLQWDGSQWIAALASGGGGGSLPNGSATGQVLRWNGSSWVVSFLNMTDLRSSGFLAQMPSCAPGQTINYQSGTDTYVCANIAITGAQVSGNISGSAASFSGPLVGDVVGTQGATSVEKLRGKNLDSTLGSLNNTTDVSKVLEWNGTNWVAATGTNQINAHYKTGAANQVLVSNGSGSNPSWVSTANIGGGVTQVAPNVTNSQVLTGTDKGKFYILNPSASGMTLTLPTAPSAATAFSFGARNVSSFDVTIQPQAGQNINSISSFVIKPGVSAMFVSDGTNWHSIDTSYSAPGGYNNSQPYATNGTFVVPTGVYRIRVTLVGGGGGGGSGNSAQSSIASGGGGGAGGYVRCELNVIPGASYTVTVGAGGGGAPFVNGGGTNTAGITGSAGGNTSFAGGVTVTANGGSGGGGASAAGVNGAGGSGGAGTGSGCQIATGGAGYVGGSYDSRCGGGGGSATGLAGGGNPALNPLGAVGSAGALGGRAHPNCHGTGSDQDGGDGANGIIPNTGGGGGGSYGSQGGSGGNGGLYGAGGGGGGTYGGFNYSSSKGGNGAPGFAYVEW